MRDEIDGDAGCGIIDETGRLRHRLGRYHLQLQALQQVHPTTARTPSDFFRLAPLGWLSCGYCLLIAWITTCCYWPEEVNRSSHTAAPRPAFDTTASAALNGTAHDCVALASGIANTGPGRAAVGAWAAGSPRLT